MSFPDDLRDTINYGDSVIIYLSHGTMSSLVVSEKGQYQNVYGLFAHDSLVGQSFGCKWKSRKGDAYVYVLRPTPELWTQVLSHRTQIIYNLDASFILHALNVRPGSVVIESGIPAFAHIGFRISLHRLGTGSGSLSHHIIRNIMPTGHLHTFEYHEQRFQEAKKEFELHNLSKFVTVRHQDVYQNGFSMSDTADAVFLDLPNPWKAVGHAKSALKKDVVTRLCTFSPCIEQIQETGAALRRHGFLDIYMVELLERNIQWRKTPKSLVDLKGQQVEPILTQIASPAKCHTSFLLFASLFPRPPPPPPSGAFENPVDHSDVT